jgi:putative ABC transport system permease protein
LTIVGVTADVRQSDLGRAPRAEFFLSALQPGPDWSGFALVVRTTRGDPLRLVPDIRAVLGSVDRTVAVAKVASMNALVSGRLAEPRIYTTVLVAFATLALGLAAVGLYGVISYSVTQRTRELGVRLALGSSPGALTRNVLGQGARLTLTGVGIGLVGAWLATQSVPRMLPIARPGDPVMLAAVAGLMLVVGSLAAYLPARRAARVDPLVALRSE